MIKYEIYTYNDIEAFANNNDYSITEHGSFLIGEGFITLKSHSKDLTFSFVLVGTNFLSSLYQCIYSDLK